MTLVFYMFVILALLTFDSDRDKEQDSKVD